MLIILASTLGDWAEILALPIAVAAAVFSAVAWYVSRKNLRAAGYASVQQLVRHLNEEALASNEALQAVDAMSYPQYQHQPIDQKRKRWLAFHILNVQEAIFYHREHSDLKGYYDELNRESRLVQILSDPDVYEWLQSCGYDPRFVRYCKRLIKQAHESTHRGLGVSEEALA